MTKSLKMSTIYLTCLVSLTAARLVFGFINLSDNLSNWLFSLVMQCGLMGLMPFLMYRFISPKDGVGFAAAAYLGPAPGAIAYLYAVIIGVLAFILNVGVSSLSYTFWEAVGYVSVSSSGTIYSGPEVLILEVLTGSMMPAVFEEITHRGVLQGALEEQGVPDGAKVMLMALFFGFGHQNILQLIPTFVVGLTISYMAVKCRSVIPGMIVHFLNNFIITFADYAEQTGLVWFNAVYNTFVNFMFSSVFALFGFMAVAAVLIIILLRELSKDQARAREGGKRKENYPDDVRDVFAGYGEAHSDGLTSNYYPRFGERRETLYREEPGAVPGGKKADIAAVAVLAIGFIAIAAGTVFTLIWGIFR